MDLERSISALSLHHTHNAVDNLATPDLPRTLQTLPGEIRNMIYEQLLVRTGPFDLRNEYTVGSWPDCRHHNFVPGIGLLATCRQFYHEAVGILYGRNKFELHARRGEDCIAAVVCWLSPIKGSMSFINHVSVICEAEDLYEDFSRVDVLPLLRLVWSEGLPARSFFIHPSGVKSAERLTYEDQFQAKHLNINFGDRVIEPRDVNSILRHLMLGGHPDWRVYSRIRRDGLDSVRLATWGSFDDGMSLETSDCKIVFNLANGSYFGGPDNKNSTVTILAVYKIGPGGDILRVRKTTRPVRMRHLLCHDRIFDRIAKELGLPVKTVVWDLDKRTLTPPPPVIAAVNRKLRYKFLSRGTRRLWGTYETRIVMRSTETRTSFEGYKLFSQWCDDEVPKLVHSTIVLQFKQASSEQRTEIRFEAIQLFRLLGIANPQQDENQIEIAVRDTHKIRFGSLRNRLTLFIADILGQLKCPCLEIYGSITIWSDQLGRLREAHLETGSISKAIFVNENFDSDCDLSSCRLLQISYREKFKRFINANNIRRPRSHVRWNDEWTKPDRLLDWIKQLIPTLEEPSEFLFERLNGL